MLDSSRFTILVVDDNPAGLYTLSHILQKDGFKVLEASNGIKALELVEQKPSLILLDVHLPDIDGFEVCNRIKNNPATAKIPILHISANYIEVEDQVFGIESGADGYLTAPIEPRVLVTTVRTIIRLHQIEEQYHLASKQWRMLAAASLLINASLGVDETLKIITEKAREIIGAHLAITQMNFKADWKEAINFLSLSDKYSIWRDYETKLNGSDIYQLLSKTNSLIRLTQAELEAHPGWHTFINSGSPLPIRGWMAAPIIGQDGLNVGVIQLSDKYSGEFTQDDEPILIQLAQFASVVLENSRLYYESRESERFKEELIINISNELSSPLTAMIGWIQLLKKGKLSENQVGSALEVVERNAKIQAHLVDDLLDISRIVTGRFQLDIQKTDIISIIDSVISVVHPAADAKGIRIRKIIDSKVRLIQGDSNHLEQVIWNLLSNAIKFTPYNGEIEIQLKIIDSNIQIIVSDTGKGIEPAFLPYVFDRFNQLEDPVEKRFSGLGLRLSIGRHIIELHGGKIEVESRGKGFGATFTVTLPLVAEKPESENWPKRERDLNRRAGERGEALLGIKLLVVDDDADIRQMLKLMLESYGSEVRTVGTAIHAIKMFGEWKPDILISDLEMAEIDGYELIRKLRAKRVDQGGQTPAIALTGYARVEDRLRAISSGYQMVVSKLIEPDEMVDKILKLAQRFPLTTAIQNEAVVGKKYILKLYITAKSNIAELAVANVRWLCEEYLEDQYQLEIVDITLNPVIAEQERLVATPALIKHSPGRRKRIIGDLSNTELILRQIMSHD